MKNYLAALFGLLLFTTATTAVLAQSDYESILAQHGFDSEFARSQTDQHFSQILKDNSLREANVGEAFVGTWDVVVTIRNCATWGAITSFHSTANFNQGGTYTGISSGSPPTVRTSERGFWQTTGTNLYLFRFKAYLYDPAGNAVAYQIVTQQLLQTSDVQYTTSGISQVYAPDGTLQSSGCSTTVGTRLTL